MVRDWRHAKFRHDVMFWKCVIVVPERHAVAFGDARLGGGGVELRPTRRNIGDISSNKLGSSTSGKEAFRPKQMSPF
jgi:hypothetical protein